jgi:hypothetical protein
VLKIGSLFGQVKKIALAIIFCDSIYVKTGMVESCRWRVKTFRVLVGFAAGGVWEAKMKKTTFWITSLQ